MTSSGDDRRYALALLERADPVDLDRLGDEIDLEAAHRAVREMIVAGAPGPDPRAHLPRRRVRRSLRFGFSLGAVGLATAGAALLLLLAGGTGPAVPNAAALTIKRATAAVQSAPGTILHVDTTLTTSYPTGQSWSTRQDTWQQQDGTLCNYVNLRRSDPASPRGTAGGTFGGRDQLYDPVRNTVYLPPRVTPHEPSGSPPVKPPTECSYMVGVAKQIRALLSQDQARVVGHATIDGKDTIEIRAGANTYYVAADGSYSPVKLINGRPTDKAGMTTIVFHAYEQLPAAGHEQRLNLTALHPTASVDHTLAGYRAAIRRLFPDG